MSADVLIEFDLSTAEAAELLAPQTRKAKGLVVSAVIAAVGVGIFVVGALAGIVALALGGGFVLIFGLTGIVVIFNTTSKKANDPSRLAGPTKAYFSAEGMRYAGPNTARLVDWSAVLIFVEQAMSWRVRTRSETFVIPRSAVSAEQAQRLAEIAKAGLGRKYLPMKANR